MSNVIDFRLLADAAECEGELIHAIAAARSGYQTPAEYIADVIRKFDLTCEVDEVEVAINHDTRRIDIDFDVDEDAWLAAYDALGFADEYWEFLIPVTLEETVRLMQVRNHRGRRAFG